MFTPNRTPIRTLKFVVNGVEFDRLGKPGVDTTNEHTAMGYRRVNCPDAEIQRVWDEK